ncbi:hypothetical protein [Marinobacterium jannaschii]|uniref:hypothetical protein n=1 Tax=Marinobacterium jannaschii TaxID=64970 RepID=UPI000AE0B6B5|nr:hypothetical protein [Marinobacterium jannaschii]
MVVTDNSFPVNQIVQGVQAMASLYPQTLVEVIDGNNIDRSIYNYDHLFFVNDKTKKSKLPMALQEMGNITLLGQWDKLSTLGRTNITIDKPMAAVEIAQGVGATTQTGIALVVNCDSQNKTLVEDLKSAFFLSNIAYKELKCDQPFEPQIKALSGDAVVALDEGSALTLARINNRRFRLTAYGESIPLINNAVLCNIDYLVTDFSGMQGVVGVKNMMEVSHRSLMSPSTRIRPQGLDCRQNRRDLINLGGLKPFRMCEDGSVCWN